MKKYVDDKYYKSEVTGSVINCAQRVHRELGNGFQEVIYQRSLAIEMRYAGLEFEREKEMKIYLQNNINLFTIDSQPEPKNCYNIIVIKR